MQVEMFSAGRRRKEDVDTSFLIILLSTDSARPDQIPLWDAETFDFEQKSKKLPHVKLFHECLLKCLLWYSYETKPKLSCCPNSNSAIPHSPSLERAFKVTLPSRTL